MSRQVGRWLIGSRTWETQGRPHIDEFGDYLEWKKQKLTPDNRFYWESKLSCGCKLVLRPQTRECRLWPCPKGKETMSPVVKLELPRYTQASANKACMDEMERTGHMYIPARHTSYRAKDIREREYKRLLAESGVCAACGKTDEESIAYRESKLGECQSQYTLRHDGLQLDHILPASKKGSEDAPHNFQLLCADCNQSKNNRDNTQWFREQQTKGEQMPLPETKEDQLFLT